ncbi:MAG: sulfotransferase domain-containing protein [Nitrososphaera sp.]|nr:sulfotransferase domain-containing protein [Nitrososphaera sp.]
MRKTIKSLFYQSVFRINYWLHNYKEVIWLISDGRSGSTWVTDLINYKKIYREMFEPFHPRFVNGISFILPHQYMRPQDSHKQLEKVASDVFNGKFTNRRVDSANRRCLYDGLLIKDIFANLFSYWASLRFPNLKIVLLIRNPFSVAWSKYRNQNWFWVTEPLDMLNQHNLYEDYLHPFEEIIRKTSSEGDYILCQILIWSIVNYVPLRQFEPGQIHIGFYEDILSNPTKAISKIFGFVKPGIKNYEVSLNREIIRRPSRTSGTESNLLLGTSLATTWKNELTRHQIDAGFRILECFGFEDLYDDKLTPNWQVLKSLHQKA